jgi:hypothetical protein
MEQFDMTGNNERVTPPKQSPDDPNVADRRRSDEDLRHAKDTPEPPDNDKRGRLPNPKDVGEAG